MNTRILISLLLCLTKTSRASDSEDVIKFPEVSSNQTSLKVTDKLHHTETSKFPEDTTLHSSQPAGTERLDTELAGTKPPDTQPAGTERLDTQPAGTKPPDTQPAGTERLDTQLAGTKPPDTQPGGTERRDAASVAPVHAETLSKDNSSSVSGSPAPTEQLSEKHPHEGGGRKLTGVCGEAGSSRQMQLLGNAISEFGLHLFKEVLKETTKPNIIISPLSIALALAQLSLGSVNETERQIEKMLHFASLNCSHYTLCNTIDKLTRNILNIASSIYIKKGFPIKPEFIKESVRFYKAQPQILTGVNAKDTNNINSWVAQMTERKIKRFLNEVPSNIVLLLLNAIHFKGLWQVQFDPLATSNDIFYKEDGSSVHVAMMQHPKYPIRGFHDDDMQIEVAKLSFKQNMSFIVVKPMAMGKLDSLISKLNISQLLGHSFKARPMPVKMPKLDISFDVELSRALSNLGLSNLFTSPNLSKISSIPLFVSSVQHKATMELKEEGVEAAASTGIAISRSLLQCNINRPFFFIIRDDISGIPIFLGTIKDPNPQLQMTSQDKYFVNLEKMKRKEEVVNPK